MTSVDIKEIIRISKEAGDKILEIYNKEDFSRDIEIKSDNSPLTKADKNANAVIVEIISRDSNFI
jgi:3'(2'), 5'-bisphosphate nucleotidase